MQLLWAECVPIVLESLRRPLLKHFPDVTALNILDSLVPLCSDKSAVSFGFELGGDTGFDTYLSRSWQRYRDTGTPKDSELAKALLSIYGDELDVSRLVLLLQSLLRPWFYVCPSAFAKRYLEL